VESCRLHGISTPAFPRSVDFSLPFSVFFFRAHFPFPGRHNDNGVESESSRPSDKYYTAQPHRGSLAVWLAVWRIPGNGGCTILFEGHCTVRNSALQAPCRKAKKQNENFNNFIRNERKQKASLKVDFPFKNGSFVENSVSRTNFQRSNSL
jgi:hypothetical protein